MDEPDQDPRKRIDGQEFIGLIEQEWELSESLKKKEAKAAKQGNQSSSSLANRITDASTSGSSSRAKKHCEHCGKDNHKTSKCRFLDTPKCDNCDRFHRGECWQPRAEGNNKRAWKGKEKEGSSKKKKEAHNAEPEEQSNSTIGDQQLALQADDESDSSDSDSDTDRDNVTVASSQKSQLHRLYDWLADSGTTSHITHCRDAFSTYKKLPKLAIAGVGDIKTHAVGKGTIYLCSECDGLAHILELKHVLHVPSNRNNLLSLAKWEKHGRYFIGRHGKLSLHMSEGTAIARGTKIAKKLYHMDFTLVSPETAEETYDAHDAAPSWEIWHKRFGHVGYSGLQKLLEHDLVEGLEINKKSPKPDCIACAKAKLSEASYGPATDRHTQPGQLTHLDLWGKYDIASIHGNRYYLLLVDDATRYVTVEFLKSKSKAARKIIEYLTHLKVLGHTPQAIRMDRGTEFLNDELREWCRSEGVHFELTAPYSPSQNGVAERMNRTLVELSRAMLSDSKLPEFLWEPAVAHAAYLRNLLYTKAKPHATPYQGWHGKRPDVSHLREFGAPVWVLLQGQSVQRKMLPKSQRRAYVGFDDGPKAVKYYNAATRNILLSRNFRVLVPAEPSPPEELAIDSPMSQGESAPSCEGEEQEASTRSVKGSNKRKAEEEIDPREPRKPRKVRIDYRYLEKPFRDERKAGIAVAREEAFVVVPEDDCRSLREAKESSEWPEWKRAIEVELDQLRRMGTWVLVDKPEGAVPIKNKFVFAKKRDKEGIVIKHKARLVAKGCAQRPGFDYLETHSPVVRLETIRAILAIAQTRKLFIQQMDIKGAYLNGKLKERVYMCQPEGYEDGTERVCLLIKTLYGLKQAGREWNIEFDTKLRRRGYARLRCDPCVYIWRVNDDFAIITVWVDDLLIFTTTVDLMTKAKSDISTEWEVTDLGEPSKIVGIEISRTEDSIAISQKKYIEHILTKEGMKRSNAVSTPLDPNIPLIPNPEGNIGNRSNSFARLLGELQYLANATRPDITYAVNRLASYTANPSLQHVTALKRILRYLSGTRDLGIIYKTLPHQVNFFHGFADAAYKNHDDLKSTTGYVFFAGDGAITWSSKKQTTKALLSTEAEYVALLEAAREACWLRHLYGELGLFDEATPTLIRGDNEGAIAMTKNPMYHQRSKHIDLRVHWIRDLVRDNILTIESCRDPDQTADVLTKALPRPKHQKHVSEMGLASI